MSRNKRLFAAAAVLSVLVVAGCGKKQEAQKQAGAGTGTEKISDGLPIYTVRSKISKINDKINSIGTVYPFEQNNIYSKGSGRLVKYLVEEGQIVKKDDVIAYVDRDEVGYEFTQNPVKSPAGGVILKKYLDVGATISAMMGSVAGATPVASVGDLSKVKILLTIVEADIGRIKTGQAAQVKMEAYPEKIFNGSVYTVAPTADPVSHTSKVEILVENKAGLIKAGMSAEIDIIVATKAAAVVIPRNALIKKAGEIYVFVIKNGVANKTLVEPGYDDSLELEIKKGLQPDELIANSDFNVIQDGLRVRDSGLTK